jgi:hypothetical protein
VFWLQRDHFDFDRPWEDVSFRLLSAFNVVGGNGWSIENTAQYASELWLIEGECEVEQNGERALATSGDLGVATRRSNTSHAKRAKAPLSIVGFLVFGSGSWSHRLHGVC